MNEKVQKLLFDILDAIQNIEEFVTSPKLFENYQKDLKTKSAVERQFGIIGEAVNKIMKIEPSIEIQNARHIVNLRNRIIHAYNNIDDTIIWAIIINHLPELKKEINRLLQDNQ